MNPFFRPVTLRPLLTLIAVTITAAWSAKALAKEATPGNNPTIVHVYTGWREAASFKRISEYFDGRENNGGEAIHRTQPNQRGGFYFLVRTTNPGTAQSVKASLELITAANAKPVTYAFNPELKAGNTVFHLGLTGADWPDPKLNPVAWKLDLLDGNGHVLATEKSYLWEKPSTK